VGGRKGSLGERDHGRVARPRSRGGSVAGGRALRDGDALDGLVARRSRTATPAGALFDASVDRYEEFFILGGLAIFFRSDARLLALVLASLLGSFMVSYGSAKAEAFCVSVPPGWMRRAERAACFSIGTALVPVAGALARFARLPAWVEFTPVLFALAIVAVVGNVSAIRRLRAVAAAAPSAELARRRLGA
jgi:CDP-diacylglycerol--glycerol-3-phosphate 3-phosphatidyltransferase